MLLACCKKQKNIFKAHFWSKFFLEGVCKNLSMYCGAAVINLIFHCRKISTKASIETDERRQKVVDDVELSNGDVEKGRTEKRKETNLSKRPPPVPIR